MLSTASSHNAKLLGHRSRTEAWCFAIQRHAHRWQLASCFPRILQESFERRTFQPLSSKKVIIQLVRKLFGTFNKAISAIQQEFLYEIGAQTIFMESG